LLRVAKKKERRKKKKENALGISNNFMKRWGEEEIAAIVACEGSK